MKKTMTLNIPLQMQLLCSLWEISPEKILQAFIDDTCQCLNSSGSDERIKAASYLLRCGYGMFWFTYDQTVQMICELDGIRNEWRHFDRDNKKGYPRHMRQRLKAWHRKWDNIKNKQATTKNTRSALIINNI
jgi:hypothetical protein